METLKFIFLILACFVMAGIILWMLILLIKDFFRI
jgi:hypothetical protein